MRKIALVALTVAFLTSLGLAALAQAKSGGSSGGSRSSFSSGSRSSSSSGSWSSSSGSSTSKSPSSSSAVSSGSGGSGWSSSGQSMPGSSSSGSSFSSSSGTSSKPSATGTTSATTGSSSGAAPSGQTWSSSSGTKATSQSPGAATSSSFSSAGASGIRKESSLKSYNDYNSKFGKSGNPAASGQPLVNPSKTYSNYSDYRADRDRYYGNMGWRTPSYAYMSYPSFGFWDAMFLWMILGHSHGPGFYYNNYNDPGVQAWRQEANRLAQSNDDLKKQLADMDAKLDQMRKDGVPVKAGTIPEGIDPSMALAADKVVKEKDDEPHKGSNWMLWTLAGVVGLAAAALFLMRRSRTA